MDQLKFTPRTKTVTVIVLKSLAAVLLIVAIYWGVRVFFDLDKTLYTNDAQVEEYINPISVRISGYIKEVRFQEHQLVKKGDTLLVIDDREYQIQLQLAEAAYLSATAARNVTTSAVNTVESNVSVSDANIKASEARLWNAQQNLHRFENLLKDGAATQQQFDQVKTEYDALVAQTRALVQQRRTVKFNTSEVAGKVSVNEADIKRARAAVDMARLNLSYTTVIAPYDGVTGRRLVQEGQLLQAGQTLVSLVRNDSKWVVANYRETQISQLHIGQKMVMVVDGYEKIRITGRITAIAQATGSRFSAIPVDNSTGNFIKVQQRIPVKIALEPDGPSVSLLRAGMNVEVRAAD